MKKIITIAAFAVIFASGLVAAQAHAKVFDLTGWAWSSNIGWLSFNSGNANAGGPISGLVAKYTFDNGTAADSGGSGYNGTLYGSPVFTTGVAGAQALVLDGVDDYALTTFTSALTDFTVCAWFKDDGVVNGHNERILDKNYSSGMWLGRNANIPNSWGGGVRESAAPYGIFITLSDNAWHQLCSVRSGTTHYIYGDGASVSTSNTVSSAPLSTTAMAIGASYAGSSRGGGRVDDVVIYNRALTVPEIQRLYQQNVGSSYSVQVATTTSQTVALFSGYAWSPNIGWLSFNSGDITSCPASESAFDTPGTDAGVSLPSGVSSICTPRVDLSTGRVSGWARILSMAAEDSTTGWLHLSGTNHKTRAGGVTYNTATGAFTGFAYEPSALGWVDFRAQGQTDNDGVVLCKAGVDPGCPLVLPATIVGTCSVSSSNVSINEVVQLSLSGVSGGTAPYTYSWAPINVGYGYTTHSSPYDFAYGTAGTYTPSVLITDSLGRTGTVTCQPSITVNGPAEPSSGLKLMIMPPTVTGQWNDYNDSASSFGKSPLRVVKGNNFKLQWNIDPALSDAGYNRYRAEVFPVNGPSTPWGGVNSGQQTMTTSNISTGKYTFVLTQYDAAGALEEKISSVDLNIVSSSVEEI